MHPSPRQGVVASVAAQDVSADAAGHKVSAVAAGHGVAERGASDGVVSGVAPDRFAGVRPAAIDRASKALSALGFEPRRETGVLILNNCPFHALAQANPELICGLNETFVTGLLDGIESRGLRAVLQPDPRRCCVTLEEVRQAS